MATKKEDIAVTEKEDMAVADENVSVNPKKIEMTEEEIEEMIRKAKEEAVTDMKKAQEKAILETEKVQKKATDDRVTIELFKDNDKYRDDLVVGVNGKYYQIQRGIPVTVPRAVAEVIANSRAQDSAAADYSKAKEQEYIQRSSELGV